MWKWLNDERQGDTPTPAALEDFKTPILLGLPPPNAHLCHALHEGATRGELEEETQIYTCDELRRMIANEYRGTAGPIQTMSRSRQAEEQYRRSLRAFARSGLPKTRRSDVEQRDLETAGRLRAHLYATAGKALREALRETRARLGLPPMKTLRTQTTLDLSGRGQSRPAPTPKDWTTFAQRILPSMGALASLNLDTNALRLDGCKALCEGLRSNSTITSLSLSNNSFQAKSAAIIADAIPTMRAMTSLNMSNNRIGEYYTVSNEGSLALGTALKENSTLQELNLSSNGFYAKDAKHLADGLSTNGELTSLNISKNRIGVLVPPDGWETGFNGKGQQGFKTTGGEWTMTPPDGAKPEGVIALADAIKNNGALTSLDISSNRLWEAGTKAIAEGLKDNIIMTELNLADNAMGTDGAMDIAKTIPTMGALTSLNISNNNIGELVLYEGWTKGEKWNENLKTWTWYKHIDGREQKEHPGGKPDGVTAITNAIPTMGALVKLRMGKNNIATKEAGEALGQALARNSTLKELDISGVIGIDGPGFAQEIAAGVKKNRALTKLDVSNNSLDVRSERDLKRLCEGKTIRLTL